ncbi:MAG TPA: 50S ribosomal protein L24 [Candidatus Limnocylindrales bacterium]|jgi:large subunit ribosomal protein L24|nr:50S ribosomal protein L24 [Candidatus Limnocylindrales bacterium]
MSLRRTRVPEIRKGDTVVVLSGKDAGKQGVVDKVLTNPAAQQRVTSRGQAKGETKTRTGFWKPASSRPVSVVIDGLNIAKRHTKARQSQGTRDRVPKVTQGGILDLAQPLDVSKVMLVCPNCKEPTRVRHTALEDGRRVRVCSHCGKAIEVTA